MKPRNPNAKQCEYLRLSATLTEHFDGTDALVWRSSQTPLTFLLDTLEDNLVRHSCATLLWDTLLGHSCARLFWDTLACSTTSISYKTFSQSHMSDPNWALCTRRHMPRVEWGKRRRRGRSGLIGSECPMSFARCFYSDPARHGAGKWPACLLLTKGTRLHLKGFSLAIGMNRRSRNTM